MQTGFFYDPIFLDHDTGRHPENAARLRAIVERMQAQGITETLANRHSRAAEVSDIALVHDDGYIHRVEEAALSGRSYLDTPDCAMSEATYRVSLHAAGAALDAVQAVAEGRLDNAFVACRPPGHHAEHHQALGFCFFNNIAVGAAFLTERMGYERVLIFDFDVHHGNGTQHTFEESRRVLYVSTHQHPRTCYPGTGYAEERGRGEGLGYTVNAPMLPYTHDADYLAVFRQQLLPLFQEYDPQFVLLSAGFDAHEEDPLAQMCLTQAAFDTIIRETKDFAARQCEGRLVSILEGGYHYGRLAECVASHVTILQSDSD